MVEAVPVVFVVGDDRHGGFDVGLAQRGVAEFRDGFLVQHVPGPVDVEGFVQRPMNSVATALPQKFTMARHSDMNLSMPKIASR